jgi:starch phosphorylase
MTSMDARLSPAELRLATQPTAAPEAGRAIAELQRGIVDALIYDVGKDPVTARGRDWLMALSRVTRDRLVDRWMQTTRRQYQQNVKRIYYLSMEFLIGRTLTNSLLATGLAEEARAALYQLGLDLEELRELEPDAALGNGGLGRLAACFLDSMATLRLPGFGYGIRYDYGMFAQALQNGRQIELPEPWLVGGNPWEFARPEVLYTIRFGGRVERNGGAPHWVDTDDVLAMAYDTIIPGYRSDSVNTLRLWSAKATKDFDLGLFNRGDYARAVEAKNRSENVSRVLYPDDSTRTGRELRLRQEYFFVSASLQDILRRYQQDHEGLAGLADKVAIHLNDTHPAIAVPELMRLLIDLHGLDWASAWGLCSRIFSYTNHTLMPEALETWPFDLLGAVLPRHLEIILEINARFLDWVRHEHPQDPDLSRRVSLVDESGERRIRMAYLSIVASHKVNGVSTLHSELMRSTIFADFARLFPGRFVSKTNGVTPRRWLSQANPGLAQLIDSRIGPDWRVDLDRLAALRPLAEDDGFCLEFGAVKLANKQKLAAFIRRETGIIVDPTSLFDMQIKRIHEYKRQLLNVMQVVARYNRILADPSAPWVPRTVIFAGKAASAYHMAKLIIRLINDVGRRINHDPRIGGLLRVVFIPNYSVSLAELAIPAADLSEQISTAGTEASGTGNMKLALNGALTIGTEDGANIEIRDQVGPDNIFIFGASAAEVQRLRAGPHEPLACYRADPELAQVIDQIGGGFFSPDEADRYRPIVDALLRHGDHYLLLADFAPYLACQERVDALQRRPQEWRRRAVLNVAGMGPFSSDRAIAEYAAEIWNVRPLDH